MKCIYSDGLRVDYSGPLRITKGEDVNVFVREDLIPGDIKNDLEVALFHNDCGDMRKIADSVTRRFGAHACVHE